MKMKKIAILLLACAALPMQAQTIGAVQHRAEHAEELLQEAKLLHNERSYDMAEHLLEQMLKGKTTRVQEREAVALLARIAYHKNYDEALGAIEAYLKKFPDAPELNRMKALAMMCYYAQGNYAKVIDCMQEVDPDALTDDERDDVVLAYAVSMIKEGRYDEAVAQLDILNVISDKYDDEVAFYTAYTDYKNGRYEGAIEEFTKTLGIADYHRASRYYLAEVMLQTKGYAEAEELAVAYLDELEVDEYTLEMTRIQGEALYGQKRYLQAAVVLEEYLAAAEHPTREAMYQLGMSHFNTNEHLRAPELFAMVSEGDDAITQSAQLHAGKEYTWGRSNRP